MHRQCRNTIASEIGGGLDANGDPIEVFYSVEQATELTIFFCWWILEYTFLVLIARIKSNQHTSKDTNKGDNHKHKHVTM